jgi:hypothetical protein
MILIALTSVGRENIKRYKALIERVESTPLEPVKSLSQDDKTIN